MGLVGGLAIWLAGHTVRQNQDRADVLAERAPRLERERELTTQLALADERQRIAPNSMMSLPTLSVMVVETGASRTELSKRPEGASEALLQAEATGPQALDELRRLLAERVSSPGLPVQVHIEGERRPLPAGLEARPHQRLIVDQQHARHVALGVGSRVETRKPPLSSGPASSVPPSVLARSRRPARSWPVPGPGERGTSAVAAPSLTTSTCRTSVA